MKRIFAVIVLTFLTFSLAGASYASVDSIYEVAVVNMKGDVNVDTNGDGTWIKPWIGMKLMESALIKTGDDSTMDIVFDAEGLNVARIKANSLTTVKTAMLELTNGKVLADFANLKPGSSFTIKTPTAACAIRGSSMGVGFQDGITTAMSFRGNLYVQGLGPNGNPQGEEETVPEGEKTDVDGNGNVGDNENLDDSDNEEFDEFQNDMGSQDGDEGEGELEDVPENVDTKDLDDVRVDTQDTDDSSQISSTDEMSDYSFSVGE